MTQSLPHHRRGAFCAALLLAAAAAAQPLAPAAWFADGWQGLGGASHRPSLVRTAPPSLAEPTWIATEDETESIINFIAQAGVVVAPPGKFNLVVAVGRVSRPGQPSNRPYLFAFSRDDGSPIWSAPIPTPSFDSFSTPAIDPVNETVLHISGRYVSAFDLATGDQRWQRQLDRSAVNSSLCVTTDLGPTDRVFVTTYDGLGTAAKLYCINLDPFDPGLNPYDPGDVVWTAPIGGSSGNTPAYLPAALGGVGMVYVTAVGHYTFTPGRVYAFPALATQNPAPVWTYEHSTNDGFFGGVAVAPAEPGTPPAVYAATYAFSGWVDSASLLKLDAATGSLHWSAPCNRTAATPVVLPGGRVVLSGGIYYAPIAPSIALFQDNGDHAIRLWDSALDTWDDLDDDGNLDIGEYLALGGWTHQPVAALFAGRTSLLAGVIGVESYTTRSPDFYLLDLDRNPADPDFIIEHCTLAGGSPAFAGTAVYSVGVAGLTGFGPTPDQLDVNRDGARSIDDLYTWECGLGSRDVNKDGTVNQADRALLIVALRTPAGPPPQAVRP